VLHLFNGRELKAGEAAAAAADRYPGDLLPDDPYEPWAELPREHLRRRRLEVLHRAGRLEELVEADPLDEQAQLALAREHLALAWEAAAPYATALGLRALATVDVHVDRTSTLREARAVLAGTPAARLGAQLDTDLAGLLLLSGRVEDAHEALTLLRSVETYAGYEELWPLQSRVRRLLDRMGEPARPVAGEALRTLTTSERRVARLAADGLTNREIALRLVVTVKAVEWHLSRVYRKLGVRSRRALAGSLGMA
jgi:DNA-binding NarL/FixJ family response regulator